MRARRRVRGRSRTTRWDSDDSERLSALLAGLNRDGSLSGSVIIGVLFGVIIIGLVVYGSNRFIDSDPGWGIALWLLAGLFGYIGHCTGTIGTNYDKFPTVRYHRARNLQDRLALELADLPGDAALSREQQADLCQALTACADPDSKLQCPSLAVSIVQALSRFGGAGVLPTIRQLLYQRSEDPALQRLMEEARLCEQVILERMEREREDRTLLRPAAAPELPETLLRPAQGVGETEPDHLLRPAAGDDVTASNSTGSGV